jgi:Protein of unknown function DUF262
MRLFFDSVMRDYPFGSLLVWETQFHEVLYREFVADYKTGMTFIPKTKEAGRRRKMVLDGQQRLQTLFIGAYGSIDGRRLYFNMTSGPGDADRESDSPTGSYRFEFWQDADTTNRPKRLIRVSDVIQWDSLIEKCQTAIREMHRPIVKSETALQAKLVATVGQVTRPVGRALNHESYDYISFTERTESTTAFVGWVSSYNINTYKGRIYVPKQGRPIPFELVESARSGRAIGAITASLSLNAQDRSQGAGSIKFDAFENLSRTARLKSLDIVQIYAQLL